MNTICTIAGFATGNQAASARSADEKVFKEEDARVRKFLLEKLSKRLARKARSFNTAAEMISWLRNEDGQDLTRNQQAEPCEPQKAVKRVKCYHISVARRVIYVATVWFNATESMLENARAE
jgi:hypothetical protein